MLKTLASILLTGALCLAQTSAVTLNISGTGTVTASGFAMTGSAAVSGFGTAAVSANGVITNPAAGSGQSTGPAQGVLSMTFPTNDILVCTFSVPAGILIPALGVPVNAAATMTVVGGTGKFIAASGSFPMVTGSGTSNSPTTSSIQVSASGTITLAPAPGSAFTRTIAHTGDGGQFKTTIILTNSDTAPALYTLRLYDNNGNVPSSGFQLAAGSLSGTIAAGESATIQTSGLGGSILQGWGELTAPAAVGATIIYSQPDGSTVQEGTTSVPLAGSSHFFVPFDNTSGAVTSMAITNAGTVAAHLSVILHFASGAMETIPWPSMFAARSHQGFTLPSQLPDAANQTGVAEFVSDQSLSAVVFRFNSTQAFTAFDIISK